ncbi:MAG: MFS transporter [Candidatus Limnocylindrales bacterium]
MLGAQSAGITSPALSLLPPGPSEREATGQRVLVPPITIPRASPELVARVRRHPYVRLALNGSFSALWAGQLVSLFGDRIHQLALAAAVLAITNSPFASAMVFVAAFVPNLLFSPVAGALVDRWDHKEVLVVSDLLRAATVLLIPIAVVANVVFVYPSCS